MTASTILEPAISIAPDVDARSTRCAYLRDDLIARVDAVVKRRKDSGESRLKRSHALEEAIELWLAVNSQKYDYRIPSTEDGNGPAR